MRHFPHSLSLTLTASLLSLAPGCSMFSGQHAAVPPPGSAAALASAAMGTPALPAAAGKPDELGRLVPNSATAPVPVVEPASKHDPRKSQANIQLTIGQMYESRDDLARAQLAYEEALRNDPNSLGAVLALARMYQRNGRADSAIALYRDALKTHRKDATLWNDFGLCLGDQKYWPEAIDAMKRATQLDPHRALYHNNLGMLLAGAGKIDEAWKEFRDAVGPAPAHYNIAVMLLRAGKPAEARNYLERAVALMPTFHDAKDLLARLNDPVERDDVLPTAAQRPASDEVELVPATHNGEPSNPRIPPGPRIGVRPDAIPELPKRPEDSDPWSRRWVNPKWNQNCL
jgi:Tfp pilus assembly protein PilF